MKKIIVSTYCTQSSLGSILQAFGLKRALHKISWDSSVLLNIEEKTHKKEKIKSIKQFVVRAHDILIKAKKKSGMRKREDFINTHIDTIYYQDECEISKAILDAEVKCLLAGSDQIWHPMLNNSAFFLDFDSELKRFSYAASMGIELLNEDKKKKYKDALERFDKISVREEECVDVLQPLVKQDIHVHIDPVFLCSADEWREYEAPYSIKGPYILVYMIYWDKNCKKEIEQLKKATSLPVIAVCSGLSRVYADKKLYDVGVEEFLWLVDNAEYIITSSFHGAAFSIIFNKRFSVLINPNAPSRINNLMRILNVPKIEIDDLNNQVDFGYEDINERISFECNRSMEYLKKVLKEC